jgi:hypothetical protein
VLLVGHRRDLDAHAVATVTPGAGHAVGEARASEIELRKQWKQACW